MLPRPTALCCAAARLCLYTPLFAMRAMLPCAAYCREYDEMAHARCRLYAYALIAARLICHAPPRRASHIRLFI